MKALTAALLAVILGLALGKQGKDMGLLLVLTVCCMVLILSVTYLQPVLSLMDRLRKMGDLDSGLLEILLKILGVGMMGEITAMVCTDAGNGAMGKTVQFLTTAVMLWLSIPIVEQLLDLLQGVMGEA